MERIPILRMGRLLLVTIQVDMHDRLAMTLQDDLTTRIVTDRATGVLIDISALDIVDSFIGRMISNTAAMAKILDARTVRGRHAASRRHHPGGTGPDAGRREHGAERGAGHQAAGTGRRMRMTGAPC